MKTRVVARFAAVLLCAACVCHCGGGAVDSSGGGGDAQKGEDARGQGESDSGGKHDTGTTDSGSGGGEDSGGDDGPAGDGSSTDDGSVADASSTDGSDLDGGCTGALVCLKDLGGGCCGDVAIDPLCMNGLLECPDNTIPKGLCQGFGPGCLAQDGGASDGGATDGGAKDGGATDGGQTDGGGTDGGTSDSGPTDGGVTDGGPPCPNDSGTCLPQGQSHFGIGIHSPRSDLNAQIVDLGDIYVRLNLWDVVGWQNIKGQEMIDGCKGCCDAARSLTCTCTSGPSYCCQASKYYFCTPSSRNNIVEGESNADTFYALQHDILFSVGPGSYGSTQPKSIDDLLSDEYPADEQTYREYIRYLVQQYPAVGYWELGNEANYPKFWGDTPENYARLIALSSIEIKSLCPACKVGISLTSPDPGASWFNAITGVCDDIDFLDLHHYQSSTMSELGLFEAGALAAWKASCPGKEIISTETGLPSAPVTFKGETWALGTSEQRQAQDIIKDFTMMFNAGYSKIFNYLIDHDFVAGEADIFESIGVLRMDGTRKVSFGAYLVMIEKLDHFVSITKLSPGQYKYTSAHKNPVYVLWCDSGGCGVPPEITGAQKVTDYLGAQQMIDAGQINLTTSPVFVEPP